jgi:hypothetical protein
MSPKPTDIVPIKLRMREALRRKIEKSAEKKAISANAEAVRRIEDTFAEEEMRAAEAKELEEMRDEFEQQERAWHEEVARKEAAEAAARRDSTILNMLIENRHGSACLLRTLARELGNTPDWAITDESKRAFADRLHQFIMNNDFANEPSE